ncbi:MAG: beta-Ig-H3/fasciclin [Halanaerobium sp.]|uniref:Putative surface protein with fasciclin (FAS1) repeats n=1 Tax=Halanaerobium saccharolyticum TaxID=43595 RepID=A0A4R6SJC6_9FIRM|nr:fasciclin domain-containing protein [Halanaerobium saccharolyticum]PUU87976.1 MAG: beta-Ig-H3/fasciclin [Halanaerobium sp.]TDQ03977.1 putative surface protein with fasciclin (FAS1) repeats [Halanaerobium saccharolyticum]
MKKSLVDSRRMMIALLVTLTLVFSLNVMVLADGHLKGGPDVLDVALEADDFNTLVTAVIEADLVGALKGDGPFTVFAPTDAAFAALPEGTLDSLLADKEQLANVLLYHVISGKVMAEDVLEMDGAMVETLFGEEIEISIKEGMVYINDAQVTTTDIEASNGVIHVIDTVLVP